MKLAVSNIAWDPKNNLKIRNILSDFRITYLEGSPNLFFRDILKVKQNEIKALRSFWENHGINIYCLQSVLYNKDWNIFKNEDDRKKILSYLEKIFYVFNKVGVKVIVFGSPKNRFILKNKELIAKKIALNFFEKLGDVGKKFNIRIALEPNPKEYNCNFLTNTIDAYNFISMLNHKMVGINFDLGGSILNNEKIDETIFLIKEKLFHVHISAPYLKPIDTLDEKVLKALFFSLEKINYKKIVSLEMKRVEGNEIKALQNNLSFLTKLN
jgi:sugar phosphate isomerase/epimerase